LKTAEQIREYLQMIREQQAMWTAESQKTGVEPHRAQNFFDAARARAIEESALLWVLEELPEGFVLGAVSGSR